MTYVKPHDLYDVMFSQISQSLYCMTSWTPNRPRRVCTSTTWRSAESTGVCGVVFITMIIITVHSSIYSRSLVFHLIVFLSITRKFLEDWLWRIIVCQPTMYSETFLSFYENKSSHSVMLSKNETLNNDVLQCIYPLLVAKNLEK